MKGRLTDFERGLLVLVVLLCLTFMISRQCREIAVAPLASADVSVNLPASIGEWRSEDIWYCQNESCSRAILESDLGKTGVCPSCGGKLDRVSLGEHNLLPADTVLVRKNYRNAHGESVVVTVVISGNDQKSIHRPQQCLPAQGYAIDSTRVVMIPLEKRHPLAVTAVVAKRASSEVIMAYWFMGGGHETHDHFRRLGWMAWDNIVRGVRSRWAYISVQLPRKSGVYKTDENVAEFIRTLYPLIRVASGNQ
jgi:EpsI family protein